MKRLGIEDIPPSYGDVLYAINLKGAASIKEICELTYKDKSTVSLIVNDIEKKGYVVKEKCRKDGRRVKIRLTPKAQQEFDKVMEISNRLRERLFKGMSEEEKFILFMLLNKIASNLCKA